MHTMVEVLWDLLRLETPLQKADIVIGFGSYNTEVPRRAAELYHEGYAKTLVFTGKLGKGTEGVWQRTEAETFRDIAVDCGVPPDAILLECNATNTGENIAFTQSLLQQANIRVDRLIAVHKAYMTKRVYAALKKQWPGPEIMTTSPPCTLEEYISSQTSKGVPVEEIINSLVGDFQRMDVFARRGYQCPVDMPQEAWRAYHSLVDAGYTKYVIS